MKSCWQENPLKRPTFACIVEQLEKILSLEYKVCFHVQNETFLIFHFICLYRTIFLFGLSLFTAVIVLIDSLFGWTAN